MTCGLLCLIEGIKFVISALSIPFYVIFVISIGKSLRDPERIQRFLSFYCLVISAGVADLCYLLHYYFLNQFREWGLLIWPAELVPFYSFVGALMLQQSQVLATLLMGLNRLVAVCWPTKYRVVWSDSFTLKTIALQWLLSLLTVVPPALRCQLRIPENCTEGFVSNPKSCAKIVFGIQITTQLTAAVALLVLYSIMFMRARKQYRSIAATTATTTHSAKKERKLQHKLAIAGGVISLVLVLYASSSAALPLVAFSADMKAMKPMVLLLYNLTATLLSIVNPFILVAMCKDMRQGMINLCCCRKETKDVTTTANKKVEELVEIK